MNGAFTGRSSLFRYNGTNLINGGDLSMRTRSFLWALIVFVVLVVAVIGMRRHGGGLMHWMAAVHGH